ncbi:amino acid adenylation domain-containing protein [Micromonospora endolithica]|nr:amino acid adenylation domain-containing protein [Micromonospora endolithica]
MWLLDRLVPDSAANNLALAFQVEGKLDADVLRAALAVLLRRHDVLRTGYIAAGAELAKGVIPADGFPVPLEVIEAFQPDAAEPDLGLRPWLTQRFVLDGRPLVRAGLFRHRDGDIVCLAFHHLVYDIISGALLIEELATAYAALAAGRPVPPELLTPVAPYHEPEPSAADVAWWRDQLSGYDPDALDLWCGADDPARPTLHGAYLTHVLSAEARDTVRRLPAALRAPEAAVLLAAFDVLLAAHGAGPDLAVGSPVSVRPRETPRAVGHHTNVLPLRVRVDPRDTFRGLVRQARDVYFGALAHAGVPVDSVPELAPQGTASWRNRLCRHLFNYFPQPDVSGFTVAGLPARQLVVENGYSKFDLEFFVQTSPQEIRVFARYSAEKFTEPEVRALVERYEALLLSAGPDADRPLGELLVWSPADRHVIAAANDTARSFSPSDVPAAVHGHACRTPDAIGMRDGDREVTYGRLWDAARHNRDLLLAAGVAPGDVVAIMTTRSPELTAVVLGVWLAGAAYLPVDPEHPAQRVSYLLADSGATVIVTDRDLAPRQPGTAVLALPRIDDAPAAEPGPAPDTDPESAAYLIYTSGSTGRPKGALLPHRAISNIAGDYTERLGIGAGDGTLWTTTFAFDMANLEHYVPLYSGGHIVVAPDSARTDGRVLRALIERYRPVVVQGTPTTFRLVLDDVADVLAGIKVVIGAEVVPVPLAQRLLDTGCEVHHAYGPTETTTWCTWGVLPPVLGERLDIGAPIANTRMMVLAPDGRELPVGVRGEVCIAGDGVALGYHGRPELNAQRFGEHLVYGRFYRSGDTGRWLPDGTLELFGRADRQVKLRGNRIELGEVEAVILGHPRVRAAAAVVVGDRSADGRLVVFVEADEDLPLDRLWEFSRGELPHSALPQSFVVVGALPVNANEKIDYPELERRAAAGATPAVPAAVDTAPDGDDELAGSLLLLWRRLLGRDDLTVESNFFIEGGHSLLGAQLVQQIEETLGVPVALADLFAAPAPAALAAQIRVRQAA